MAESPVRLPIPVRPTVCVLVGALSFTVNVPERVPTVVGVNVTVILQLVPAASVFGEIGHVEVCAKLPVVEMPEIVSAIDCAFFNVTD